MSKTLQIDKAVDKHLKPVKDLDGTSTALEISAEDVRVKNLIAIDGLQVDNIIKVNKTNTRVEFGDPTNFIRTDGAAAFSQVTIPATNGVYFDGGTHTYIAETADDRLAIIVGGQTIVTLDESRGTNNRISNFNSAAGFEIQTVTYNASTTAPDFSVTNKAKVTFGSGNITNMSMKFPSLISGNFTLLLKQDGTGSRTVTNWKAFDGDENTASGSASVVWAGGSAPTLTTTANKTDILSFFWDADAEIAYGVASLNF